MERRRPRETQTLWRRAKWKNSCHGWRVSQRQMHHKAPTVSFQDPWRRPKIVLRIMFLYVLTKILPKFNIHSWLKTFKKKKKESSSSWKEYLKKMYRKHCTYWDTLQQKLRCHYHHFHSSGCEDLSNCNKTRKKK